MAKGLLVEFYMDAVHMTFKSEQEGRPIFEDREFIRLIPIGDNKTVQCKEASLQDKQKYADEYAVFSKGVGGAFSGTPLTQWPSMLPAQIKLLNHFNVYTVDQLAELDDQAIGRIGPGTRELHEKARAFILKAAGNADSERFASENLAMKEEIARLSSMVKELSTRDKSNNKVAA